VISCIHPGINEIFANQGSYATHTGSHRRFDTTYRSNLQRPSLPLDISSQNVDN